MPVSFEAVKVRIKEQVASPRAQLGPAYDGNSLKRWDLGDSTNLSLPKQPTCQIDAGRAGLSSATVAPIAGSQSTGAPQPQARVFGISVMFKTSVESQPEYLDLMSTCLPVYLSCRGCSVPHLFSTALSRLHQGRPEITRATS